MLLIIRILPLFILAQHQDQRVFALGVGHLGGDLGMSEAVGVLGVDVMRGAVGEVPVWVFGILGVPGGSRGFGTFAAHDDVEFTMTEFWGRVGASQVYKRRGGHILKRVTGQG